MSLNLITIYAYQSFCGFVFHHIALLVSAFMAGLSLGAWIMIRSLAKMRDLMRNLLVIESFFALSSIGIGLTLLARGPSLSYFLLSMLTGFFTGIEFPLANKIYTGGGKKVESGGLLYGLDLLGSWIAALFISMALVPLVGIVNTCTLLFTVKLISLSLLANNRP